MTPYEEILKALRRAAMGKTDISRVTGVPFGPLGHALEVLTIEGKVIREGLRYRLPAERTGHPPPFFQSTPGVWGCSPRPR